MMQRFIVGLAVVARRLAHATGGNVAIIFALTLPVLLGAAGLGVETSYWYYRSLQLQSAADAAAYAAELEHLSGSAGEAIESVATVIATENGFEAAAGSIEVFSPPQSGPNAGAHAAEVRLSQDLQRYFTAILSDAPVTLSARAVARAQPASKACMLALNRSASKAVLFSGSSSLTLTGCAVMSNSQAADALKSQGAAVLRADCLISAGGVELNNSTVMTSCTLPITRTLPAVDPFTQLPEPEVSNSCQNTKKATLQPGTYCNGLSLSGTVQLDPGTYVIEGGDFKVNANAMVTGSDVVIYLSCGSQVSMNGNATVQLAAPTTGTYSGILFYGDRGCQGGSHTFNGTAASLLTGALYFAQQDVNFLGNFSGKGGCSQIVAGTIQWSGNTTITHDCTSLGMQNIPAHQLVRLVE